MTNYDKIGPRDDDPPGARFDGYAVEPPAEPWVYILDEPGIKYRRGLVAQRLRPGWWPFVFADADREQSARRPPHGANVRQECGAASVRLSPDTEFYAWRNEHVIVRPDATAPHLARAHLKLWVRPQGMGGVVVPCTANLDLKAQTCILNRTGDDWPDALKAQAEAKAAKLAAFFTAAQAERDALDGPELPLTSSDLSIAAKQLRTEMIRAYCEANDLTFMVDSIPGRFTVGGKWMSDTDIAVQYLPSMFPDSWAAVRHQAASSGRLAMNAQGPPGRVSDRDESSVHGLLGGGNFPHVPVASPPTGRRPPASTARHAQAHPGRRS